MHTHHGRIGLLASLLVLAGCQLAPAYERPDVGAPAAWQQTLPSATQTVSVHSGWWQDFKSPELDRLVTQALLQNNDMQASLARVAEARAQAKIAGSNLWPEADASGGFSRTHEKPGNSPSTSQNGYRGLASVAYELDLWGRNRDIAEAAEARLDASRFDHEALALVTASDVAEAYFQLLSLKERLAIAHENYATTGEVMDILDARFKEGAASALEVSEQKTAVATAEASLVALENLLANAQSRLAVLLGLAPANLQLTAADLKSLHAPVAAPLQPTTLLTARPDLRRAEATLEAAHADIGAARAAFFPSLSIGANLSAAATPASMAATTASTLLASAAVPIFKGGELTGGVELSEARKEELAANYRSTVLTAFKEAEDALAAVRTSGQRLAALQTASTEARNAYRISRERYKAGAIDFLTLLQTQQSQLSADDAYLRARLDTLSASISLFKAMGGGFAESAD